MINVSDTRNWSARYKLCNVTVAFVNNFTTRAKLFGFTAIFHLTSYICHLVYRVLETSISLTCFSITRSTSSFICSNSKCLDMFEFWDRYTLFSRVHTYVTMQRILGKSDAFSTHWNFLVCNQVTVIPCIVYTCPLIIIHLHTRV